MTNTTISGAIEWFLRVFDAISFDLPFASMFTGSWMAFDKYKEPCLFLFLHAPF